ncbi:MAG: SURF1 family protein [Gemmatimonadetes bacterium]|nr:SURF1 family protein [Gemmatimonadota bacterium]
MTLARRDVAFLAFAVVAAGVCARLGVWQLDRLHQRRARNAEIAAARARPPLELAGQGLSADSARDRRIRVRGVFDYDHETVWRARTFEGVPGVDLITSLRLSDGSAVLVDRGWVPSPDAAHVDHRAYRESDSAVVEGLGMTAPRARADVNPRAFADSVPYPLLPFIIQELPPSSTTVWESSRDGAHPRPSAFIRRWPPPALDDGPHLSYAIQWFSFAAIVLVGTGALLRKGKQGAPLRGEGEREG